MPGITHPHGNRGGGWLPRERRRPHQLKVRCIGGPYAGRHVPVDVEHPDDEPPSFGIAGGRYVAAVGNAGFVYLWKSPEGSGDAA